MSEEQMPASPEQDPQKKLDLNKETIKELDEAELDQVAGGALGTGGGKCKAQSLFPACNLSDNPDQCNFTPKCNTELLCPTLFGC